MSSKFAFLLAAVALASSAQAATLVPVPAVSGAVQTFVFGINDKNVIVGDYENADGSMHAFYGTLDGQYTTFDFDEVNLAGTEARGIDDHGNIIGIANVDAVPGFPNSGATGINKAGLIAVEGYSADFSQSAPYIYCPLKKSKCPVGGTEIADAQPIRMPAGGIAHRVAQAAPKPLTRVHAAALLRQ